MGEGVESPAGVGIDIFAFHAFLVVVHAVFSVDGIFFHAIHSLAVLAGNIEQPLLVSCIVDHGEAVEQGSLLQDVGFCFTERLHVIDFCLCFLGRQARFAQRLEGIVVFRVVRDVGTPAGAQGRVALAIEAGGIVVLLESSVDEAAEHVLFSG